MKIWNFVFCFLLIVGFTLNAKAERKYNSFGFPIGGSTCELALADDLSGTAEELFQQAQDALKNEKFCEASRILIAIPVQFPWSGLRVQTEFLLIDALHKAGEFDSSITAAKKYVLLHVRLDDPKVEYAYYMIGENFFLERNEDDVQFDQIETLKSQIAFNEYLKRYPNGKYVNIAKGRMQEAYNVLSAKELAIGRHYFDRKKYLSAAARLQNIPKIFKNSTDMPEAISLLVECYWHLDKKNEANAAVQLLGKFFPSSEWTKRSELFLSEQNFAKQK